MGIHRRYAAAFLILFTSWTVQAGQVNVPKRSVEDLIKNVTPVLNDNALGYVRAEGNYPFTYNNKAYSAGPILQTTNIPKTSIATSIKNGLKVNPAQLALDATIAATLAAVGWVMTDGVLSKKIEGESGTVPLNTSSGQYFWYTSYTSTSKTYNDAASDVQTSCNNWATRVSSGQTYSYYNVTYTLNSDGVTGFCRALQQGASKSAAVYRTGNSCPTGSTYDSTKQGCVQTASSTTPVVDSDYSQIDTFVSGNSDPDFLNRALKASCEGSLAPARCYQALQDAASHLHSGPSTVKGPSTTSTSSTTNVDGTKSDTTTFKETQFQLGYNADGFTWRDDTTTTTTNPDGTQTVSHESTEDNSATPEDEQDDPLEKEYAFEDKDFPEVTPFYEQKYKEGFKSVWEKNQASFDNSAFISFLKSFVPSFSGSCPAFGLSFNIATWANYGSMDFMSICYVLDFVKSILLVSSLFLCRALIFGG